MENPENIKFIDLTSENIPLFSNMIRKLYELEHTSYLEADVIEALQKFIDNKSYGAAWLIYCNDIISGYMIIAFAFSVEFKGETAFLDELYIEKEFRGNGIGKKALLFAEDYAKSKGLNALRLEVDTSNKRAQKIYRENGFIEHERYIMTKKVNKN